VLNNLKPTEVLFVALVAAFIFWSILSFSSFLIYHLKPSRIRVTAFRFAKKYIPAVRDELEKQMRTLLKEFAFKYGSERDATAILVLPDEGTSPEKILDRV